MYACRGWGVVTSNTGSVRKLAERLNYYDLTLVETVENEGTCSRPTARYNTSALGDSVRGAAPPPRAAPTAHRPLPAAHRPPGAVTADPCVAHGWWHTRTRVLMADGARAARRGKHACQPPVPLCRIVTVAAAADRHRIVTLISPCRLPRPIPRLDSRHVNTEPARAIVLALVITSSLRPWVLTQYLPNRALARS